MNFGNFNTDNENKESINFRLENLKREQLKLDSEIDFNRQLSNNIKMETTELGLVQDILMQLKDIKMETKKQFILDTINLALHDIFMDNLSIDIKTTNTNLNNKIKSKYDIIFYQNGVETARNEKLLENNGGGVLSVISILFKIIVGYIYSDNHFYMFDESLSQVSSDYRPRLSKFIQKFCTMHNFSIVLVSQTEDIEEHADLIYRLDADKIGYTVSDKVFEEFIKNLNEPKDIEEAKEILKDPKKKGTIYLPSLKIIETKGNYPSNNYYYTKIKNFQSIVDIEFRFKGFTIVRGRNNIGKSASLRAIQSLLFNNFDVKEFPRKYIPRTSEVSIEFGYIDEANVENNLKKIKLQLEGTTKVAYLFDDNKYIGKQLAFDKVKEKVEQIGFKYISLKQAYSNFKGNIKDQTERLAYTNQHDGMYLIGNKSSEIEKVFNFLFDTYNISIAILNVKLDIKEKEDDYNNSITNIVEKEKIYKLNEKEILILESLYKLKLIQDYKENNLYKNNCLRKLDHISILINKKNILLNSFNTINNNNLLLIDKNNLDKNNILEKIRISESLIYFYQKLLIGSNNILLFQNFNNKNITSINQHNKINILIPLIDKLTNYLIKKQLIINNSNSIYNYNNLINNKVNINIIELKRLIEILNKLRDCNNKLYIINNHMLYINNKDYNITLVNNNIIKSNIIKTLIFKLSNFSFIKTLKNEQEYLLNLNTNKTNEQFNNSNELENIDIKFGLKKCSCCDGLGYQIKENK